MTRTEPIRLQETSSTSAERADTRADRIRVAFVGKGGAGKSSISGTFARLLARVESPVLALDSDPMPGMPYALGIAVDDRPIPDEVVVEGPPGGPQWVLHPDLDGDRIIERHGIVCPDGPVYLQFGNLRGHLSTLRRAQFAWSQVVREIDDRWHIVGDLPAGTRQAMAGWAKYASVVCVVVEPTVKSLHSARRLLNVRDAEWGPSRVIVVANKVRTDSEIDAIGQRLGTAVDVAVPAQGMVAAADRRGCAPLDAEGTESFVAAVSHLVDLTRADLGRPADSRTPPDPEDE